MPRALARGALLYINHTIGYNKLVKSPDLGPVLKDFNVLDFNGTPDQELKRSVASLLGGITMGYGVAVASGAFIGALVPQYPDLAQTVKETSTILITGASLATLFLTYFHATFAAK